MSSKSHGVQETRIPLGKCEEALMPQHRVLPRVVQRADKVEHQRVDYSVRERVLLV